MLLLRKIILILQIALSLVVITMAFMLWYGDLDFKNLAHFLGLISILTGMVIFTSCTSPDIRIMKRFFLFTALLGFCAGIASSFVFWKILPPESWYYINLCMVFGICFSLFTETEKSAEGNKLFKLEKPLKLRSVVHVTASIIILLTLVFLMMHILGWVNLQLPLLILTSAVGILLAVVIVRNRKQSSQ